jgi:hypothetical protein
MNMRLPKAFRKEQSKGADEKELAPLVVEQNRAMGKEKGFKHVQLYTFKTNASTFSSQLTQTTKWKNSPRFPHSPNSKNQPKSGDAGRTLISLDSATFAGVHNNRHNG